MMDLSPPSELPSVDTIVRATVLIVLGVVLLSGPLVPFVDFTPAAASTATEGEDSATVSVVEPPADEFRIAPARFGAGTYLYSPTATVSVGSVTGSPTLVYELRVPGLGRTEVGVAFLSEANAAGELTLELERATVDPATVTESSYPGAVEIRVREGSETRVLYERNVTVAVEGLG